MTISRAEPDGARRGPPLREAVPAAACIRSIAFAAYYAYSPSGRDPASHRSRRLCAAIKAGDPVELARCVGDLRACGARWPDLRRSLGERALLVPVPASAPRASMMVPDAAQRIAAALLHAGFGGAVHPLLLRQCAVRKSATAPAGARPTVAQHYASFEIADPPLGEVDEIVLIDDVVTRGRTLLAAACRLRAVFPRARIGAFTLMRTMGFVAGLADVVDPCIGEIRWRRGDAVREP